MMRITCADTEKVGSALKSPAEKIIEDFGGLTPLADAISRPVSTVQGWKERGRIPQDHWLQIIQAGQGRGIALGLNDFLAPSQDQSRETA